MCVVYDVTAEESLERVCVFDGHEWLYKSVEQLFACSTLLCVSVSLLLACNLGLGK